MNKIPKEIVDKMEQRNSLNAELQEILASQEKYDVAVEQEDLQ